MDAHDDVRADVEGGGPSPSDRENMVRTLLQALPRSALPQTNAGGKTALHIAAASGTPTMIMDMVRSGHFDLGHHAKNICRGPQTPIKKDPRGQVSGAELGPSAR